MPEELPIFDGPPIRSTPFPARRLFNDQTKATLENFLEYYSNEDQDFGTAGHFEKLYTDSFVAYMGNTGFCSAVCSGTAALFASIAALNIPKGSIVLVSPITDPGSISSITLNGLVPKLVDTLADSFLLSLDSVIARYTNKVAALMVVHAAGKAVPNMEKIKEFCLEKNIYLIEDCSQAHGAMLEETQVGNYGDIAILSTMFSKNHSSGGTGGLIYTQKKDLHNTVKMHSDRGKPFHDPHLNTKDPSTIFFPALNLPLSEMSSAIGIQTLNQLDASRNSRIKVLKYLESQLQDQSKTCRSLHVTDSDSPFYWPVFVQTKNLKCTKLEFCQALLSEGAPINPDYKYLVHTWPWAQDYLEDKFIPRNAVLTINSSFNLLFNERFSFSDIDDVVKMILRVENYFLKP